MTLIDKNAWTPENIGELTREFDPREGNLGRARQTIPRAQFLNIRMPEGWTPFMLPTPGPGGNAAQIFFPILAIDFAPSSRIWRAFTKEEDGRHLVVAFETDYYL